MKGLKETVCNNLYKIGIAASLLVPLIPSQNYAFTPRGSSHNSSITRTLENNHTSLETKKVKQSIDTVAQTQNPQTSVPVAADTSNKNAQQYANQNAAEQSNFDLQHLKILNETVRIGSCYTGQMPMETYPRANNPFSLIDVNNDGKFDEKDDSTLYTKYVIPAINELYAGSKYSPDISNVFIASNILRHLIDNGFYKNESTNKSADELEEFSNDEQAIAYGFAPQKSELKQKRRIYTGNKTVDKEIIFREAVTEAKNALLANYYQYCTSVNKNSRDLGNIIASAYFKKQKCIWQGVLHAALLDCVEGLGTAKPIMDFAQEYMKSHKDSVSASIFLRPTKEKREEYNRALSLLNHCIENMTEYAPASVPRTIVSNQKTNDLYAQGNQPIPNVFVDQINNMLHSIPGLKDKFTEMIGAGLPIDTSMVKQVIGNSKYKDALKNPDFMKNVQNYWTQLSKGAPAKNSGDTKTKGKKSSGKIAKSQGHISNSD